MTVIIYTTLCKLLTQLPQLYLFYKNTEIQCGIISADMYRHIIGMLGTSNIRL